MLSWSWRLSERDTWLCTLLLSAAREDDVVQIPVEGRQSRRLVEIPRLRCRSLCETATSLRMTELIYGKVGESVGDRMVSDPAH